MTKTKTKKILGIDFETANQKRASACSVGLCLKELGAEKYEHEEEILIDPDCEFSAFNILVHGIHAKDVNGAPKFTDIYPNLCELISQADYLVAHNASFDISVLRRSCERYELPIPNHEFICTLQLARAIVKKLPSYSLDQLSKHFELPEFSHHRSLEDAKACVSLLEHLMLVSEFDTIYNLSRKTGVLPGSVYSGTYKACSQRGVNRDYIGKEAASSHTFDDGDNMELSENCEAHPLYQKVIVFTGTLSGMSRSEAEKRVVSVGGICGKGTTKKTNYLVYGYLDKALLNGNDKSAKLIKAEKLIEDGADLQLINEVEFWELLNDE